MTGHSFAAGTGSLPSIERAPPAFAAAWVLSFSILWDDMILGVAWRTANFSCSWENKNVTWLLWGLMLGYPLPPRPPAVFVFQRIPSRASAAVHVES